MCKVMSWQLSSEWKRALAANPNVRVLFEFSPAALRKAGTAPELLLQFFRERGFELYETEGARLKTLREFPTAHFWIYEAVDIRICWPRADAVETDD